MFLLGMSFVGLALLATAVGFGDDFLIVAVIVLAFDFLVGVSVAYVRVMAANGEDFYTMHAMNQIGTATCSWHRVCGRSSRAGRTTMCHAVVRLLDGRRWFGPNSRACPRRAGWSGSS